MLWLDVYERRARLVPGLLALLPLVTVGIVLGLRQGPAVTFFSSVLSLAGGPLILAELVRHQGRKTQESLWKSWGGAPTTKKLRTRESSGNSVQQNEWREAVSSITGIELLSARAERRNPTKADETIEVSIGKLRNLTRNGERFPLVEAENRGYGFHRNFYGIRWFGRGASMLVLLGVGGYISWVAIVSDQSWVTVVNISALILASVSLIFWFLAPSAKRVWSAADRYAYELLQAAVFLNSETSEW
ncbi:hypothetical protein ACFQZ2_03065 [Streptomonospora algeriensis]|uniref:Uncharacterized protein n=1 Tax=Streptomonospora algeriensis TaxID=995084 RepID=A0ABW3BA79_9ACTN